MEEKVKKKNTKEVSKEEVKEQSIKNNKKITSQNKKISTENKTESTNNFSSTPNSKPKTSTNKLTPKERELLERYNQTKSPAITKVAKLSKLKLLLTILIPTMIISIIVAVASVLYINRYVKVLEINFTASYVEIDKDDENNVKLDFPAKISPANATNKKIIYTSSDERVATVEQNGTITFYKFGLVTITAKSADNANIKTECQFFVTDDKAHYIEITNKKAQVLLGEFFNVATSISPDGAIDKTVTYNSSNPEVAIISSNGKLLAIGGGTTTITVTTANGKTDSFELFVIVPVARLSIENSSLVTGVSAVKFPQVSVLPANATYKGLTFSSLNSNIATIDQQGNITFKQIGEAVFTATSQYDKTKTVDFTARYTGGYVDYCFVAEESKNVTTSYELDKIINLQLDYFPIDADINNITYFSNNENVIKVVNNKLVITGGGKAIITVSANTGSQIVTDTAEVFVSRPAETIIANDKTFSSYNGEIEYTILPSDHTSDITVTTQSKLITISNSNQISFVYPGTASVKIQADNGVEKVINVSYITAEKSVEILQEGQLVNLEYLDNFYFNFEALNYGNVNFTEYNSNILSYDSQSKCFTAIRGGTTSITAVYDTEILTYKVFVKRLAERIEVTNQTFDKYAGKLNYKILPEDHTNKVTISSASNIASIIGDNISFAYPGEAEITISTDNDLSETVIVEFVPSAKTIQVYQDEQEISVNYLDLFYLNFEALNFGEISIDYYDENYIEFSQETHSFKAIKGGKTTMQVSSESEYITLKLLINREAELINAEDINFVYKSQTLTYSVLPSDHTNSVEILSSSPIIEITSGNLITFLHAGSAYVEIKTSNGLSKVITVSYIPVNNAVNIVKDNQKVDLDYQEALYFDFSALGLGAIDFEYDTSTLSYDRNTFVFTAIKGGATTIKATSEQGSVNIDVFVTRQAQSITANDVRFTSLTQEISYTVTPSDYTNEIILSSQSPIININGNSITFVYAGSAYVDIKADNGVTKTIKVSYLPNQNVKKVTEDNQQINLDYLDSFYLDFSTFNFGIVSFEYDKTALSYSADNFVFTTIKGGATTIKATSGEQTILVNVFTTRLAESISASDINFTSTTQNIVYTVFPVDHTNKVEISSTSPLVNINGNLATFIYAGSAEVIISTDNGLTQTINISYIPVNKTIKITEDNQNINVNYLDNFYLDFSAFNFGAVNFEYDKTAFNYSTSNFIYSAIKGGNSVIKATSGEQTITINVFTSRKAQSINASDIMFTNTTQSITYEVLPSDSTSSVSLSSSSSIINIDGNTITFVYAGTANVTISTDNGITKTINVSYIPTQNVVKIEQETQDIQVNYQDVFYLDFSAFNMGAITFENIDSNILTYNANNFTFTAVKGGGTNFKAISGEKQVNISVSVYRKVESFDVSTSDITLTTGKNNTAKKIINFTTSNFMPSDATMKNATYSVDDNSIASVTQDGVLTFIKAGSVMLTIKADNTIKAYSITSTFGKTSNFYFKEDSCVIEDVGLTYLIELESFVPLDYVFDVSHVSYYSNNDSVAVVDENGLITAIGKGIATISVTVCNVTKSFTVEVKVKTKSVSFAYNGSELNGGNVAGSTIQLSAMPMPANANNQNVIYSVKSGDATINQEGVLTIAEPSDVVVMVATEDTGVYDEITLTRISDDEVFNIYDESLNNINNAFYVLQADENITSKIKLSFATDIINSDICKVENVSMSYTNNAQISLTKTNLSTDTLYLTRTFIQNKELSSVVTFDFNGVTRNINYTFMNLLGLELEYDNAEDVNFGPEQKRVFGTTSYINGSHVNYILLPVNRTPATNEDAIYYFSEDESIATIENGNVVVQSSSFTGELKVVITVGNKPDKNDCKYLSSYEFTLIPGCNIYNTEGYDYCVTNYTDKTTAITMVFQANLGTEQEQIARPNQAFDAFTSTNWEVYNAIVGNGYILNYNYNKTEKGGPTLHNDIRNIYIRGRDKYIDNSLYYVDMCVGTITMEYCDLRYLGKVWIGMYNDSTKNADGYYETYIKNTYIGHCRSNAVHLKQNNYNLYIENVIFEDAGMAAMFYENGNVYIKGFCDIKNFVKASDYPTSLKLAGISLPINPQNLIKDALTGVKSTFSEYVDVDKSGNDVLNMPIATYGTSEPGVKTVYFYDNSTSSYVAVGKNSSGVDNCTGLNYTFLSYKHKVNFLLSLTIHAWGIKTDKISYNSVIDATKIYRLNNV